MENGEWIIEPKINIIAMISYGINHYLYVVKTINGNKTNITPQKYKSFHEIDGMIHGTNYYK